MASQGEGDEHPNVPQDEQHQAQEKKVKGENVPYFTDADAVLAKNKSKNTLIVLPDNDCLVRMMVFALPLGTILFGLMIVLAGIKYAKGYAEGTDFSMKAKADGYNILGIVLWSVLPPIYYFSQYIPGQCLPERYNFLKQHIEILWEAMDSLGWSDVQKYIFNILWFTMWSSGSFTSYFLLKQYR